MDISGKITHALEARTGTSARTGNPWKVQSFVIETHEQFPKHCVFDVFGEDRLKEFNIQVGDELTVSFDIDAHEYNGRWFNSIRAWRVQRGDVAPADPAAQVAYGAPAGVAPTQPAAPTQNVAAPAPSEEGTADDLPF